MTSILKRVTRQRLERDRTFSIEPSIKRITPVGVKRLFFFFFKKAKNLDKIGGAMNNIKPKDISQMKQFTEMPRRHQAHLFLLSVWAYYIRHNKVEAWKRYWRAFRQHGGFG